MENTKNLDDLYLNMIQMNNTINITEAQYRMLAYQDLMLKNIKSDKQKQAIEYKQYQKILKKRKTHLNSLPTPNNVIRLHNYYWAGRKIYKLNELTEEQIEREVEQWEIMNNK